MIKPTDKRKYSSGENSDAIPVILDKSRQFEDLSSIIKYNYGELLQVITDSLTKAANGLHGNEHSIDIIIAISNLDRFTQEYFNHSKYVDPGVKERD